MKFYPLFRWTLRRWRRRFSREGQTLVEYSLVLAVISVVCLGVMGALSREVATVFSAMETLLDTAQSSH
jgi:Flp pilus assembly pilin Flp